MSMSVKKVKLFMVEGPSDETALALIFKKMFSSDAVMFDVVFGDVVLNRGGLTPREAVRKQLIDHVEKRDYNWKDLAEIIHIADSDGVFIGDDNVVRDESCQETTYTLDKILTPFQESVRFRNRDKSAALDKLRKVSSIKYKNIGVPYRIYYMSRNLEHALYGIVEAVPDSDKKRYAQEFRRKYKDDLEGFSSFIRDEIGVAGDYVETWEHLHDGANSLQRGTNLHLILPDQK